VLQVIDPAHVHAHLELEVLVIAEHGGDLEHPIRRHLAGEFASPAGARPDVRRKDTNDRLLQEFEARRSAPAPVTLAASVIG